RIGRSAMSLYRHIDGKEDLTELMYDTALGELDLDAIPPGNWRGRLAQLCAELRTLYLKHPWLSRLGQRPALGPNSLRQLEFAFGIVDGLGLEIDGMLDVASTALQFTQGFVQGELSRAEAQTRTGMDDAAWREYLTPYIQQLLEQNPGGYFQRIILDAEDFPDPDAVFERRLGMVLDGIAVRIGQAG
ncbi:MAG: putative TetR-family transcriptional regulator, partial [Microbacteriaceae bacterium]|nr:putative TetR-family transcriptional regulator [Microbacteriaceae bacterium]